MSEFKADDDPTIHQPVGSVAELVQYIAAGAKPVADWRVGTEYEKVGVLEESGVAAPFSGTRGIEAVLAGLADRFGWQPKLERGRIIALTGRVANITVGAELGIVFLGLGIQPVSRVDEIECVPKRRYQIMGPYMTQVGTLGQRMMKQTATVQANFDFGDESDAMRKFRVAMGLVPIVSAMFANSSIAEGRVNGFMTLRGHIWTDTDAARSGMLAFAFSPQASIEDYVEYALDVPMYFIIRNGDYVEMHPTFRQFLREGWAGQRATLEDWALHLTTLFPEVRMKRYLEVRSADSQPPEMMLALPALLKGILYERDSLDGAWDLVRTWTWPERVEIYRGAQREGLHARVRRIALAELARELVAIGASGLRRQNQLNERGEDERIYLDRLEELVRHGNSLGRTLAELWEGSWNRDVRRLIAHATYRLP